MTEFVRKNLGAIRAALDHHNHDCPVPATAILLNPVDHGLLGHTCLWGLPVKPDERVRVKKVRIECDGSAWEIEAELAEHLRAGASATSA